MKKEKGRTDRTGRTVRTNEKQTHKTLVSLGALVPWWQKTIMTKPNNINNKIRFDCSHLIPPSGGPVSTDRLAAQGGVVAAKNAKGREEKKQKGRTSRTSGTSGTGRTGGKDRRAEEQKRRREEKTMKDRTDGTDGTNEKQGNKPTGYLWGSVFPLSW